MTVIARATDRWGRAVELTDDRWRHILIGHAELASMQGDILLAIAQPDFVTQDAVVDYRLHAYRAVADHASERPLRIKVCVEYGTAGGTIVTAFLTRRIKPGETHVWP